MGPKQARAILERHGLAAHRDRGQNFLTDDALAARLVSVAGVAAGEAVLEIGTGLGILTRALAEATQPILSIEIDAGLVRALEAESLLPEGVTLLHADALRVDFAAALEPLCGQRPVRVVANLPYRVATPLLRRFLDLPGLSGIGVMVQREVADRIRAGFGDPDYGSLSVLIAWSLEVEASLDLHPRCFYPVPRVTSTFLRMTPRGDGVRAPDELEAMERVLRAGFAHRRKTVVNALQAAAGLPAARVLAALEAAGGSPRSRAQELSPLQWRELASALAPELRA